MKTHVDELWLLGPDEITRVSPASWHDVSRGWSLTYAARLGRRWFIVHSRWGDRVVMRVASKEAALLAWRIMK